VNQFLVHYFDSIDEGLLDHLDEDDELRLAAPYCLSIRAK
jgi:hypothetical protein